MSENAQNLLQQLLDGALSPRECALRMHADPTFPVALGSGGLPPAELERLALLMDAVRWEYAKLASSRLPDVAYGSAEHAAFLASMPSDASVDMVSENARADFIAKLESDIRRTLGAEHVSTVSVIVENFAELERDDVRNDFDEQVAGNVQQYFMDTHVHTTWPPCPAHPTHPLWYANGGWRCARNPSIVVPVGALRAVTS